MVEVVFHLIILWQAEEVAVLHTQQVFRSCTSDVHGCKLVGRILGGDVMSACNEANCSP